jgi:hypothetical protein
MCAPSPNSQRTSGTVAITTRLSITVYSRALLTFRREGASWRATRQLKEAIIVNPYVADLLMGARWRSIDSDFSMLIKADANRCS